MDHCLLVRTKESQKASYSRTLYFKSATMRCRLWRCARPRFCWTVRTSQRTRNYEL